MMDIRFNPPPGWPLVGRGGLPPADWHPDRSLPAAPTGWPFYLDQRGQPVSAPADAWMPSESDETPTDSQAPGRHRGNARRRRWPAVVTAGVSIAVVAVGLLSLLR